MLWRRCLKGLDRDWDLSTIRTVCRVKPFVQMASAPCQHSSLMWGMCVVCGMKVDVANGTNLIVSGGVKISQSESEAARIQELKIESLKKTRKLALVLDLDHTLLHSVQVEGPKPAQSAHPGFPDIHHLPIEELINGTVKHLVMKKRPYLDKFLAQAHEICQMTVYTAGKSFHIDLFCILACQLFTLLLSIQVLVVMRKQWFK